MTLQSFPKSADESIHGVGGIGLSSAEARRIAASVGILVATMTEVLIDLSGTQREKIWRKMP